MWRPCPCQKNLCKYESSIYNAALLRCRDHRCRPKHSTRKQSARRSDLYASAAGWRRGQKPDSKYCFSLRLLAEPCPDSSRKENGDRLSFRWNVLPAQHFILSCFGHKKKDLWLLKPLVLLCYFRACLFSQPLCDLFGAFVSPSYFLSVPDGLPPGSSAGSAAIWLSLRSAEKRGHHRQCNTAHTT